ncbi:MAG: TRAP transporter substrate-binding protein [Rhodobiaceae bacterium]|nr:TRAP transporter substrate-binding protein [Rhodobiaceae bacterium]MCC0056063.1 TRAP transporter substrate-binding protein [Rhodobiaceae bacterium]
MKMNRFTGFAALCALATGLFTGMANAEPVVIKYSRWLPVGYYLDRDVVIPWLEQFEKVTNGRVKVELTPKGVGTVTGQYDVVADGLADMSFVVTGYTPGRFPATEGLELPFLGDDMTKRCPAVWDAYDNYLKPAGTFKEVEVLGFICSSTGTFAMANKWINSVDDFKGLKIRTPAPSVTRTIELLGATPISKPASELYEMASSGIIDGAVFPLDPIPGFKLEGVLKAITEVPGGTSGTVVVLPINKATWAKISPEDQAAIRAISGRVLAENAGVIINKAVDDARKIIKDAGGEIRPANDKLVGQLKEKLKPLRDDWVAEAKKAGLTDPEAMLTAVEAITMAK